MSDFDKTGKSPGWHTAFYYLSRHLNYLTEGELTDKSFYGLVGINAATLNHPNPQARKSTAAELSRTVHSNRYARDMRDQFIQNVLTFDEAAEAICKSIRRARDWSDGAIREYLAHECWPDVWRGLANEKADSRPSLNLDRINQEAKLLFGNFTFNDAGSSNLSADQQMAAMLHIIAFGFLDTDFMKALVPGTVTSEIADAFYHPCKKPCLIKYSDESCASFVGEWDLPEREPFVIGRRTDSDSIESNMRVSGRHGCVYKLRDTWYYEDLRSLNGSVVVKRGNRIDLHIARESDDELEPIPLDSGDLIVIANRSCYWFGERSERSALSL